MVWNWKKATHKGHQYFNKRKGFETKKINNHKPFINGFLQSNLQQEEKKPLPAFRRIRV